MRPPILAPHVPDGVELVPLPRGAELAGMRGVDVGGASTAGVLVGDALAADDVLVPAIALTARVIEALLGGSCAEVTLGA